MYLIKLIYLLSYLTLSASNFGNKEPQQEEKEAKEEEGNLVLRNISLFNGQRIYFPSSYGDFVPLNGIAFHGSYGNTGEVGAMIITPDGREALAVTDNGYFVSLQLGTKSLDGLKMLEIEKISRRKIRDIGANPLVERCTPYGLIIDGVYEGDTKGDFYVSCTKLTSAGIDDFVLKLKDDTATEEVFTMIDRPTNETFGMTGVLRLPNEAGIYHYDKLLMTTALRLSEDIVCIILTDVRGLPGYVWRYTIKHWSTSDTVAVAQLSNRDFMALTKKSDADGSKNEIAIEYYPGAGLARCIVNSRCSDMEMVPIYLVKEIQGYDLPNVTGLAIHEYPNSDYYLLYIIGNRYNHDLGRVETQLSKYLWVPKGNTNPITGLIV